jgi:hypothetical protein
MLQLLITLPVILILLLLFMSQFGAVNKSVKSAQELLQENISKTENVSDINSIKQKYAQAVDDYAKASNKALEEVEKIKTGL